MERYGSVAFHCMSQIPKRAKGVEDPGAMRTEPNLRGTGGSPCAGGGSGICAPRSGGVLPGLPLALRYPLGALQVTAPTRRHARVLMPSP